MIFTIKLPQACAIVLSITTIAIGLLPSIVTAKPITTTDLLQTLRKGEPWDQGVITATKTVMFEQTDSGSTNATSVSKIRLSYFTSANCTGAVSGSGSYSTPDGTSYTISVGRPFGLVAASIWKVGRDKLSIADMTTIQSVAVTLKSTNSNTPQAAFTTSGGHVISYACIPISCGAGVCTSGSGTQRFTLKTTAAVGDPADGGVIGCQNTGTSFNLFNIVVTTSDQSPAEEWGGAGITTGATNTADGAANTEMIFGVLGTASSYAARTCKELSVTGGFVSGWFLPSGNAENSQLNCLYQNRLAIETGSLAAGGAGFGTAGYWSSTETSPNNASRLAFSFGTQGGSSKAGFFRLRCVKAF